MGRAVQQFHQTLVNLRGRTATQRIFITRPEDHRNARFSILPKERNQQKRRKEGRKSVESR